MMTKWWLQRAMVMESPILQSQIRRLAGWGDIWRLAEWMSLTKPKAVNAVCSTKLYNLYEYVHT